MLEAADKIVRGVDTDQDVQAIQWLEVCYLVMADVKSLQVHELLDALVRLRLP